MKAAKKTGNKGRWGGTRTGSGRPSSGAKKRVATAFTLPPQILADLSTIARAKRVSRSAALVGLLEAANIQDEAFKAMCQLLDNAPIDDEEETEEERLAVEEAYKDLAAGRVHTMEEVKRQLGL